MAGYLDIAKYVDKEAALSRIRGNTKLYRKMLDMLISSEEFGKLETALAQNDTSAAADTAHAIKGMTGNLSLPMLFDVSTRLMGELRQGNADAGLVEEYHNALEQTLNCVKEIAAEMDAGA